MPATVHHVHLNIDPANQAFYRDLMAALGWPLVYDADGLLGYGEGPGWVWIVPRASDRANDRNGAGLNHLALAADSVAAVDAAAAWLRDRGVPALYDTPCHRPEFAWTAGETYYQVMFDSPDGILFEVVYLGPA